MKVSEGNAILDIGCGPGDVLSYLPRVDYWGFDISQEYIDQAQRKFGPNGNFRCKFFEADDLKSLPKFDIALMSGVLHHLDDERALELLRLTAKALKPDGCLVTVDPCFASGQSLIARSLICFDRGKNVRNRDGYHALVSQCFSSVQVEVIHKTWIPYTHCYTVCR